MTTDGPSRRSGGRSSTAISRAVLNCRSSLHCRCKRMRTVANCGALISIAVAANLSICAVRGAASRSCFGCKTKVITGVETGRYKGNATVVAMPGLVAVIICSAVSPVAILVFSAFYEDPDSRKANYVCAVIVCFAGVGMRETGSVCSATVAGHYFLGFS